MKKLMILGAGMLQDFVIEKAAAMGVHALALDMNPDSVGFAHATEHRVVNIVDRDACLACAREEKIDGVLTAATDYGVLAASHVANNLNLPGISPEAAMTVKNKFLTREKTAHVYARPIQFFELDSMDKVHALEGEIRFPAMVKPCDGSGSKGAGRTDNFDQLVNQCALAFESSLSGRIIIETFLDGEEYGVESFVYNGEVHVLAVMKKYMTQPPYYAELGHSIPCGLDAEVEARIRDTAKRCIEALGVNFGCVNMDLLLTEGNYPYIVDIGARMGGNLIGSHIIPEGTGIDYMGNMIRAYLGEEADFSPRGGRVVSTALLALTPGKIAALPDFDELRRRENVIDIVFNKQIGDEIRFYKNNLDGCGYVVVTGESEEKAHELAFALRDEIDKRIIRE